MNRGIDVEWLEFEQIVIGLNKPAWGALQRRARPHNAALTTTLVWANRLPDSVKPTALLRHFPRIANHIAASWRDPAVLNRYLQSLLLDERGNRRGFPSEVQEELVQLRAFSAWCQNKESWSALVS